MNLTRLFSVTAFLVAFTAWGQTYTRTVPNLTVSTNLTLQSRTMHQLLYNSADSVVASAIGVTGDVRLNTNAYTRIVTNNVSPFNDSTNQVYNGYPCVTELDNGHLYAVWTSTPGDAIFPGYIYSSVSSDRGTNWGTATKILTPTNQAPSQASFVYANVTMMPNGNLLVSSSYFETNLVNTAQKIGTKLVTLIGTPQPDDSVVWLSTNIIHAVTNSLFNHSIWAQTRPRVLNDGSVLWAIQGRKQQGEPWYTATLSSTDNGATWSGLRPAMSNNVIAYGELEFDQLPSGRIIGIVRAEDEVTYGSGPLRVAYYARSVSEDNGVTWSAPTLAYQHATSTNTVGQPALFRLRSGQFLLVTRNMPSPNAPMYMLSNDEGVTWSTPVRFSENTSYNGAGGLLLSDGNVGIALGQTANTNSGYTSYFEFTPVDDVTVSGRATNTWFRSAYKTANQTVNNSATVVNDTHLSLPIEADSTWVYEINLFGTSSTATPDFKWTFTGPASPTIVSYWGTPLDTVISAAPVYGNTFGTTIASATTAAFNGVIGGLVVENGANAGTIQLQWAQNTATGEDTTVLAGSYIRAKRLK